MKNIKHTMWEILEPIWWRPAKEEVIEKTHARISNDIFTDLIDFITNTMIAPIWEPVHQHL